MTDPLLLEIPEELFSERLTLRVPRAGYGRVVSESFNASLPELGAHMNIAQSFITAEDCELEARRDRAAFILRERLMFQIFLRSSEVFLGEIGFCRINWEIPKFEFSYWIDSRQTRNGYMTEAVQTLVELAFKPLQAKRVELICDANNAASCIVAEKTGFVLEGILRSSARLKSSIGLIDQCVYARVRP